MQGDTHIYRGVGVGVFGVQGEKNVEGSVLISWLLDHEWSVATGGEEKEEIAVFFVMQSYIL